VDESTKIILSLQDAIELQRLFRRKTEITVTHTSNQLPLGTVRLKILKNEEKENAKLRFPQKGGKDAKRKK